MNRFSKSAFGLRTAWRGLCHAVGLVVLLFLVLLLVLRLAIAPYSFLAGHFRDAPRKGKDGEHDIARLVQVYPGRGPDEIEAILQDTRQSRPTGPLVLNPPPYASRHVNILPEGYRSIGAARQRPYTLDPEVCTVFVFGGSTTWGYGLPDQETIPAQLQRHLDASRSIRYHVFNYGVCASYSRYEMELMQRLIRAGRRPDVVVFIDGLNEFCRIPLNRPRGDEHLPPAWPPFLFDWVIRPALFWRDQFAGSSRPAKDAVVDYGPADLERAGVEFRNNWRMVRGICDAFGIRCILVLQPISVYAYPLEENLFLSEEDLKRDKSYYLAARNGYRLLLEQGGLDDLRFLDLHAIRCDGHEYLDTCHYTAAFASEIARAVSAQITSTSSDANPM